MMTTAQAGSASQTLLSSPVRRERTWRTRLFGQLGRSPVGVIGALMVTTVLAAALFAPWLAPFDPAEHHRRDRFLPPTWIEGSKPEFILGTDQLGRDVLSRVLYGSRISVIVGISAALVSGATGALLGLTAGLAGGWVDQIISRFIDILLSIPFIILVLAVIGILGPSLMTIILVLGFTGWAGYARVVRGETLSIRQRDYVAAARTVGVPTRRIALRHVLPNTFASILVLATLDVAGTILAESSLSFLGLGVQPPAVTWGLMIADGREYIATAWWLIVCPGVAIALTVLGIIFLGDWLRDVLDPKLRE
jgi:peptide/nickel transport system permease protein